MKCFEVTAWNYICTCSYLQSIFQDHMDRKNINPLRISTGVYKKQARNRRVRNSIRVAESNKW